MFYKYKDKFPNVIDGCFVSDSAAVVGEVILEEDCSVWFNAVIRADGNYIHIGKGSNIQDNCTLHINKQGTPLIIGENVTVGHGVVLHGCKVASNSLIGMGAIILDGAEIGEWTIIGAGSLVPGNKIIPSGVLCIGTPAKVVRELTEEEKKEITHASQHYINLSKDYL